MMNTSYLLLGGNLGNRHQNLHRAEQAIAERCGAVTKTSALYETEAWGKRDQPLFLNQALELQTALNAHGLLHCLLEIEEQLGRKRMEKFGPRLIDLDILLFNNEVLADNRLQVPHPQMLHRRFALQPLAEVAPHLVHPVLGKTILQLLQECADPLQVFKVQSSGEAHNEP